MSISDPSRKRKEKGMSKNKLSNTEIAAFCEQLAFMIEAGISLQESLIIIREDTKKGGLGFDITQKLLDHVENGGKLWAALDKSGMFPDYMVNMVQIGEASGRLDDVLDSLRLYYERNEAISRGIRGAVTYPLVMIVMMLAVILVIILQIMPAFGEVFQQLGSEAPPIMQSIMRFGEGIGQNAVVIIAALGVIALAILFGHRSAQGKTMFSTLFEKVFRRLSQAVSSGRFASVMALMLSSGMDVDRAIEMSYNITENASTKRKIAKTGRLLKEGKPLADSIVQSGLFTGAYGRMISIGFRTGTSDVVMRRISAHYEEDIERRINTIVAALEPTLVAVLSLIVGFILMTVMVPLMGVMSAIG